MPKIFVDNRESKRTIKHGKKVIPDLIVQRLEVGDVVSDNLCIERKTVQDFASSVYDGRIFKQAIRMKKNYSNCYIFIEGKLNSIWFNPRLKNFSLAQYIGTVASLAQRYDVPVISVENLSQFWNLVDKFIEKNNKDKVIEIDNSLVYSKPTGEDVYLRMLQQISGLGKTKAQALLNRYKFHELFFVDESELLSVKGIGKGYARRIKAVMRV
jgi:ERCC4-type nuclease